MMDLRILGLAMLLALGTGSAGAAEECDETCQTIRNAQDPLADVRAVMTDNTIAFGTADDQTSYGFQVQPVYSIPTDRGYNVIARGIIPVVGAYEGAGLPPLGPEQVGGSDLNWGIGDSIFQAFFVPQSDGDLKFGIGPQFSLRTRTDQAVGGPGWGAGIAGVAFGFAGNLSYGALAGHLWGEEDFSLTMIQPIALYNMDLFGGSYIGYNNTVTYDWKAKSGDGWQVPLGLTFGKVFAFENGYSFDASAGAYKLVSAPKGGADWQFKFGLSLFWPGRNAG